LQIDHTLVSRDLLEVRFCCDLGDCRGRCCVEGDSGAPLSPDEIPMMEACQDQVRPYLSQAALDVLDRVGVCVTDADGDVVTPLVEGRECIYTVFSGDQAMCAFELAFLDGKSTFRKPLSCHLYPVRITSYRDYDAVNYHRWDLCKAACRLGAKKEVPLYVFLREPLIRKYGPSWYEQLCYAASHLEP